MRVRLQKKFEKPSRTKQAFKDECDVNKILAKYQKTQMLTHVNSIKGSYGDFSNVTDFQSALNAVQSANEAFMGLPASIRSQFGNDPAALVEFVSDSKNYEYALELGLLDEEKAQAYRESKLKAQQKAPSNDEIKNDDKGQK